MARPSWLFSSVFAIGSLFLLGRAWATEESVADSVRKYRFLAKSARDKGEFAEAVGFYREYLKYMPQDPKALFYLGESSFRAGDQPGAKSALGQVLLLDSLHVNANLALYNVYMRDESLADSLQLNAGAAADSAAQCLERVLRARPDDAGKRRSLADLYRRLDRLDEAIPHYERLVADLTKSPTDSAGSEIARAGQEDLAKASTEAAKEMAEAKSELAAAAAGQSQAVQEMATAKEELTAAAPAEAQAAVALEEAQAAASAAEVESLIELVAVLYEEKGDPAQALAWRQRLVGAGRATSDDAARLEELETMLRLQVQTGDIAAAMKTLRELAVADSANGYSYYSRLATLAEQAGDQRARQRAWEGMARANPRDLETVALLVEAYLGQGSVGLAEQWLDRGLRANSRDAHLQLLRGDLLVRRGDQEGAIAAFELAKADRRWEGVAQQRIWELRPPETAEEKLKREFFGKAKATE